MGHWLLASDSQAERGRKYRRGHGISFYVGRNGSGKSMLAVYDSMPDLEMGRKVLSTVRLTDWANPRPCEDDDCTAVRHGKSDHLAAHKNYVPFTDWLQLLDFQKGVVLMDEVTGIADSNSSSLPSAVENMLAQMRRDELFVRITCLNWIRAHKRIREAASIVTRCQGFMPTTAADDDGEERLWRQRRLSVARTYDAQSLPVDDHTDAAYEAADLLIKSRFWIPGSQVISAYDTYEKVNTVGSVSDAGLCVHCNGTRRRPECSCSDYVDAKKDRRASRGPDARSAEDRSGPVVQLGATRSRRESSVSR